MIDLTMISTHHNYDDGYIGLADLEFDNLPQTLPIREYELLLKTEFHISLVCVKKIAPIINKDKIGKIEAEIIEAFKQFIEITPLIDYEPTGEFRLVKRDERVTLVALVTVAGIESFFTELERKYNKKLPVQVTHITLYTLQPEAGIGILSSEELRRDSEAVDVPLQL